MSDGYTSSPTHTVPGTGPGPGADHCQGPGGVAGAGLGVDPRVRFSTNSREEVSLYGTPKEEIMPNVNSSRYRESWGLLETLDLVTSVTDL